MKKSKLFLLLLATGFLAPYAVTSYADTCESDPSQVYCVYTQGTHPHTQGKVVRVTFLGKQTFSFTQCFNDATAVTLDQDAIDQNSTMFHIGDGVENSFQFNQCQDMACTTQESIKTADFTLAGKYPNYVATPAKDSFQLDWTYGVTCNLTSTNSIHIPK